MGVVIAQRAQRPAVAGRKGGFLDVSGKHSQTTRLTMDGCSEHDVKSASLVCMHLIECVLEHRVQLLADPSPIAGVSLCLVAQMSTVADALRRYKSNL